MSYTPPAGDAADFSWVGVGAYTPPAGDAADFAWAPSEVIGTGAGTLEFTGAGVAEHTSPLVEGEGAGTLSFTGAGTAAHGIAGAAAGALSFAGAGTGAHGIAGAGEGALGFAGAGVAVHPRYEARGVVRQGGVLLNRRVRLYDRLTGALLSQGDTVAGKFNLHSGFEETEVYAVPIDLSDDAVDWRPPVANRVRTVLAQDVTP